MADEPDSRTHPDADASADAGVDDEVAQDLAQEWFLHTLVTARPRPVLQIDPPADGYLRSRLGRPDEQ